jgi:hypothetical protein
VLPGEATSSVWSYNGYKDRSEARSRLGLFEQRHPQELSERKGRKVSLENQFLKGDGNCKEERKPWIPLM